MYENDVSTMIGCLQVARIYSESSRAGENPFSGSPDLLSNFPKLSLRLLPGYKGIKNMFFFIIGSEFQSFEPVYASRISSYFLRVLSLSVVSIEVETISDALVTAIPDKKHLWL